MSTIYQTKAEGLAVKQEILNQVVSGIKDVATQANAPTTYTAEAYPNGLFETYVVRTPLTMPNNWGSAVTQSELDANFVYFDVDNGVVTKFISAKIADVNNITNITNENTYNLDSSQIVPSEALYNNPTETLAGDIIKRVDINTGENVNYRVTTTWHDGSAMDDTKVDGGIFIKKGAVFYKRQFENSINIKWFGAKGDGITDDTIAIQKAFDYGFNVRNVNFVLGSGIFIVSNTLFFPARCTMKGSGMNESILKTSLTNIALIEIREQKDLPNDMSNPSLTNNTIYTRFSDFSLYGVNWNSTVNVESVNETNIGINVLDFVKIDFERLAIRGFLGHGINIDKVYYIKFNNLFIEWNSNCGLNVSNATSVHSVNCEFRLNGKGVMLNNTYAWSFVNPLIESNILGIVPAYSQGANPDERSSIGILLYNSWGGQISGGYFEEQLVAIFMWNSFNIDICGSFICNNSTWQQPPNYMSAYCIYFLGTSHSNTVRNNSFLALETEGDVRMYFDITTYGNTIEFNKNQHFEWLTVGQAWNWVEFKNNGVLENSPKVICHETNVQYLYGKKIPLNGMFYGSTADRPEFTETGFQYLNTDLSVVQTKIGPIWI